MLFLGFDLVFERWSVTAVGDFAADDDVMNEDNCDDDGAQAGFVSFIRTIL